MEWSKRQVLWILLFPGVFLNSQPLGSSSTFWTHHLGVRHGRPTQQQQQHSSSLGRTTWIGRNHDHNKKKNYNNDLMRSMLEMSLSSTSSKPTHKSRRKQPARFQWGGFYYGISGETISRITTERRRNMPQRRRANLADTMYETLEELRIVRQEIEAMRKEMQRFKGQQLPYGDEGLIEEELPKETDSQAQLALQRRKAKEAEKLAANIEHWARELLDETIDDGWQELECNRLMKASLNPMGRTRVFLKWMKDSRGDMADQHDDTLYPCVKCISTIDAPIEDVCAYLSDKSTFQEYNDVIDYHKDVEEISPSAKICWNQSPQILFLKPRDFVTFCHHRWKKDGTAIIVNQAVEHPAYPVHNPEKEGKPCRAYAFRGANIFSKSPDDPEKTLVQIVAHGSPGGNVPKWAGRAAVNSLAHIEPFKLFHKINNSVKNNQSRLRERRQQLEAAGFVRPDGRCARPIGIAQLGYSCYWPNGGGLIEDSDSDTTTSSVSPKTTDGKDESFVSSSSSALAGSDHSKGE